MAERVHGSTRGHGVGKKESSTSIREDEQPCPANSKKACHPRPTCNSHIPQEPRAPLLTQTGVSEWTSALRLYFVVLPFSFLPRIPDDQSSCPHAFPSSTNTMAHSTILTQIPSTHKTHMQLSRHGAMSSYGPCAFCQPLRQKRDYGHRAGENVNGPSAHADKWVCVSRTS